MVDSPHALSEGQGEVKSLSPKKEECNQSFHAAWCADYGFDAPGYEEWDELLDRLSEEFANVEWTNDVEHASARVGTEVEHRNPHAEPEIDEDVSIVMIGAAPMT